MRTSKMTGRSLLSMAAAVVLAVGCAGSPDQAGTETAAADAPAEADETDTDLDDETDTDLADEATGPRTDDDRESETMDGANEDQDTNEGDEGGTALERGSTRAEIGPVPLDLADRHPMGVVVEVHELRTEGNQVLLDVDIINGATQRIVITTASWASDAIRLVDDVGGTYALHATDEEREVLRSLSSGENLSGTLAFHGPLDRNAESLELVINVSEYDHNNDGYDPQERRSGLFPKFVIGPIELQAGE